MRTARLSISEGVRISTRRAPAPLREVHAGRQTQRNMDTDVEQLTMMKLVFDVRCHTAHVLPYLQHTATPSGRRCVHGLW